MVVPCCIIRSQCFTGRCRYQCLTRHGRKSVLQTDVAFDAVGRYLQWTSTEPTLQTVAFASFIEAGDGTTSSSPIEQRRPLFTRHGRSRHSEHSALGPHADSDTVMCPVDL